MADLEKLEVCFQDNFISHGELGASVSVWQHGEEILNLAQGWNEKEKQREWTKETLVPVYSATKGPASAVLLRELEKNGLTPESRVVQVWSEFPNESATFSEMMSHQCGLSALDQAASVYDYDAVITAIEAQEPNWELGDGHGYHPRTYGFLLDKCVRLLSDETLSEVWYKEIAQVLGLDLFIGLPEAEFSRAAKLYPGKMDKSELDSRFYKEFNQIGSLVRKAFGSPRGLHAVHEMNTPQAWQSRLSAMGGVSTASALAKFYQACIGEIDFFSDNVREWMQTSQIMGNDKVLCTPTHFSCGFQKDPLNESGEKSRRHYGESLQAFGHPGAGGSHALGDPESGLSFAYTMNQMDLSVLPGAKSSRMIAACFS